MSDFNNLNNNHTNKSTYVETFKELAKAIIEGCNEIEISAELGPAVIRIKAIGVVAFMTCISATGLSCYYLTKKYLDNIREEIKEESKIKKLMNFSKIGAGPAITTAILGPTAAYACLIMISVGGIDVLKLLRKYRLDNSNGKYILIK